MDGPRGAHTNTRNVGDTHRASGISVLARFRVYLAHEHLELLLEALELHVDGVCLLAAAKETGGGTTQSKCELNRVSSRVYQRRFLVVPIKIMKGSRIVFCHTRRSPREKSHANKQQ